MPLKSIQTHKHPKRKPALENVGALGFPWQVLALWQLLLAHKKRSVFGGPGIRACMHACMNTAMHSWIHACIHACKHTCVYSHHLAYIHKTQTFLHAYIHAYMHAYRLACTHARRHACTRTYVHANMHDCCFSGLVKATNDYRLWAICCGPLKVNSVGKTGKYCSQATNAKRRVKCSVRH